MTDSVKVSVVRYPDRDHLVLRWRDPITGKPRCKTSGTTDRHRDAEREPASSKSEILEGQHGPAARMSWPDFREYHETHCLSAMKTKSVDAYLGTLNVFERFHKPERLSDNNRGSRDGLANSTARKARRKRRLPAIRGT